MSVTPRQEVTQSASTLVANGAEVLIAVPRPTTSPAGPPAVNTRDHVSENPFVRKEFEAGYVQLFLGSTFVSANVFLTRLAKVASPVVAPQDPDSTVALFPNGADQAPQPDVVFEDLGAGLPTNSAEVDALLKNLTVRSGEALEVTLRNASGGDLTDFIRAHFETGRNPAEIVLRDQA